MFAPSAVRQARLDRLLARMVHQQLDALVLTQLENVRYATDARPIHSIFFTTQYSAVIVPGAKPVLLASEADTNFVTDLMPWVEWEPQPSFVPAGTSMEQRANSIIAHVPPDAKRIGFDTLSLDLHSLLADKLTGSLVPAGLDILKVRAIKDAGEIAIMEQAVGYAHLGMEAVRAHVAAGVAEYQLCAEAIYAMKYAGAEAESHMPALRSGEHAARLYRVDTDRRLLPGDTVVADLGARHLGYSAEYCRTFVTGRPSPQVKEMYQVLMDAYLAGIDQLRPGRLASDADQTIRRIITQAGYPDYPHATGHGIGMANGEYPTVNRDVHVPLEPGMVICLEPGIYVPGVGGVKEEDLMLITEDAPRLMTYTAYDAQLIEGR